MTLPGGNLTRDEARKRARLVSNLGYRLSLDLRGGTGQAQGFRSETVLRFDFAEPGGSTFLDLSARSVEEVEVNGRTVEPRCDRDAARLYLDGLAPTNEIRVVADCAYQRTGVGLHRFVDPTDGAVYLHTQFEPFDAHRVFACFDQPDLKGPVAVRVTAPASWVVLSNAPEQTRHATTRIFHATPPLPPYLVAVVAGPFHQVTDRHGQVPLGLYCRQSMSAYLEADEWLALTRQGLDFFATAFDRGYPFAKYDQVAVPEFAFGAMENAGCVTFSERYLFRGRVTAAERAARAATLLHEMAHMWFGDLVTMRWWDDLWLNESFATFMGTLACERATRFTDAWVTFADSTKAWARRQDELPTTHPIAADAPDVHTALQNFDGITYAKGAAVLRQLVAWVGEEAFLTGCRCYFDRYAYANADLDAFLAELEVSSGRDLTTWAKAWLTTAGVNTLSVELTTGAAVRGHPEETDPTEGVYRRVALLQSAPERWPTLRPHRVAVTLYDHSPEGQLVSRCRETLDVNGVSTPVAALTGQPVADLVLVNDDDGAYAKLRLDDRSLTTVTTALSGLADPVARAVCWGVLWDMVRDGSLPAGRFVAAYDAHAPAEPGIQLLASLHARGRTAVLVYGDPSRTAARRTRLASHARHQLETAPQASDAQLAWARQWIATAGGEQTTAVGRLLDGTLSVAGLTVDTELRWHAARALAAAGAGGEDLIAAEERRDPTDMGAREAEAARAARPDPDAKRRAWQQVVDDDRLSHSLLKAVMAGFMQHTQPDLIRPYVKAYFAALRPVWNERPLEIALAFAERMFPLPAVDEELLAATDAFLDGQDVPAPLRRILREQQDTARRMLAARSLDRGWLPSNTGRA